MLTAEQYARAKELMCDAHDCCEGCPFAYSKRKMSCGQFAIRHPAETVKLVEIWWEQNKHKYPVIGGALKSEPTESGVYDDPV